MGRHVNASEGEGVRWTGTKQNRGWAKPNQPQNQVSFSFCFTACDWPARRRVEQVAEVRSGSMSVTSRTAAD